MYCSDGLLRKAFPVFGTISALILLASCATHQGNGLAEPPAKFSVESADLPAREAFELVLRSEDDRRICVDVERWPNEVGAVHFGADFLRIVHDQGSTPAKEWNLGFCPGGCGVISLEPKREIRAIVPYAQFGDVEYIASLKNKKLVYELSPILCE